MTRSSSFALGSALLICSWSLSAAADGAYHFHRPVTLTAPGWVRLVLPGEVLDKARPQLGDLRVFSGTTEVPYVLEENLTQAETTLAFTNVESVTGKETRALLDRGARPSLCSGIELNFTEGPPYLKPVVLESSDDRINFARIAQGSLFSTEQGQHLALRFAPNDKRYIRVSLDDRLSAPVHPLSAVLHQKAVESSPDRVVIKFSAVASSDAAVDTYALELPEGNLMLNALEIDTGTPVFVRSVRIYETFLFRGELSRRLVSEGVIRRAPGGEDALQVQANEVVGRRLELEVERAAAPIKIRSLQARVRPRALLFFAPTNERLEIAYGSSAADAPKYDLVTALASARPSTWSKASLGPIREEPGLGDSPVFPRRGQAVNVDDWETRQAVRLPAEGRLAYLDLPSGLCEHLASLRIVDADGAQVPYVVESEARHTTAKAQFHVTAKPGQTEVVIENLATDSPIEAIGLLASAPEFFERSVQVSEGITDARGEIGRRTLSQLTWKRVQGDPPGPFWLSLDRPRNPEVTITIDEGDNAGLTIADVLTQSALRRVDFAFTPGENLAVIWDNSNASAPRYDVALMAETILKSPALPATLGPVQSTHAPTKPTPQWFWWAATVAGLVVAAMLARTLLTPVSSDKSH